MDKYDLVELLEKRSCEYSVLLGNATKESVSEKWGSGVGAPISLEPYRIEILGIKPGRILKGKSEPGVRKYKYEYDAKGRLIHVVAYGKLGGAAGSQDWMKSDEFYEYEGKFVFRYVFGNTFKDNKDSQLTRIISLEMLRERAVCAYQLEKRNLEYTRTVYTYDERSGLMCRVVVEWPEGPYPDRVLRIEAGENSDDVKIFELRDQREIPVYPEP
jgi:YD repeat-containing protein